MFDDELIGQQREIGRATMVACDACGRPLPRSMSNRAKHTLSGAEDRRICPGCYQAIERGDVPVDVEHRPDTPLDYH